MAAWILCDEDLGGRLDSLNDRARQIRGENLESLSFILLARCFLWEDSVTFLVIIHQFCGKYTKRRPFLPELKIENITISTNPGK